MIRSPASGTAAAGAVSIVIAVERFVNGMLMDRTASDPSTPFIFAAVCATGGIGLVAASAIAAWRGRSDRPDGGGGR